MNKKCIFITIILAILLLCGNVFAASNNYVSLKKEKTDNKDEIKIIVSIKKLEKGALGLQGTFDYKKDDLEILETNVLNDNFSLTAFNKENGKFIIEITDEAFFDEKLHLNDEDVLEVVFKVNKKSDINLKDIKMVDSQLNTIESEDITLKLSNNIFLLIIILVVIIILSFIFKNKKIKK